MPVHWTAPYEFRSLVVRLTSFTIFLIATSLITGYSVASPSEGTAQLRQLIQLAEYIGADYGDAVDRGQIVNAGEYKEMVEFSNLLVDRSLSKKGISGSYQTISDQALRLQQAILYKENVSNIRKSSNALRDSLLVLMPQFSLPRYILSDAEVEVLFQKNCGACHGSSGHGDVSVHSRPLLTT